MAPRLAKRNTRKFGRQDLVLKNERTQPQGIKKRQPQPPSCKSARLRQTVSKNTNTKLKHTLLSSTSNTTGKEAENRKRKRSQEDEASLLSTTTPSQMRPRAPPPRSPIERTIGENTAVGVNGKEIDPFEYWRKELSWPKDTLDPESNMNHLLAR